ncbi:MAG TPA: mandelate racemase/muconate lactonizing enzyme family protein [Candidatus Anammoximicrobium sp.]|nr:mandelate racemase/muconate lactonizing enzyme family protein [Candidatus Anammoximicrobium sp.]
MKITAVKTWLCDAYRANLAFVKIETDAGVHGCGEATIEFHDRAVIGCLEDLTPELLGRDPRDIEALWHDAYRDAYWRGGPVLTSALAGLEMACWDIKGKVLQQPVWQLLGGRCRDRVRCYANAWFVPAKTPAEFAAKDKEAVARGWKALKWDPFGSAYRDILRGELRDAVRCVAAVREAVGDTADLLIEGHGRFNVPSALRIGQALAEFGILWFEEPLFPELNAALPGLKQRVPVPIAAGERIYTRYQAREFLDNRCGDFIQPDISHVGIKEMRLIGGMADAAGVGFCPHNPAGPITNLATLHVAACTPNFFLLETMATDVSWRSELSDEDIRVENGEMLIPTRPGLGIELNEAALANHPPKHYHLRHYRGDLTAIRPSDAREWFRR